ncbi:MAG: hypothetical protein WBZ51_00245, partial [Xanthobacteraceae bacterium]
CGAVLEAVGRTTAGASRQRTNPGDAPHDIAGGTSPITTKKDPGSFPPGRIVASWEGGHHSAAPSPRNPSEASNSDLLQLGHPNKNPRRSGANLGNVHDRSFRRQHEVA